MSNSMKINIKKWVTARKSLKKPPEIICGSDTGSPDGIPIKAELFSAEQMERYGQKLAHSHKLSSKKLPYYLLKRLEDNESVITSNCYLLNAGDKAAMTPAGEWLLDNYYLIEEQIRVVRHHLPKNFGKGLPPLASPHNCPRIYDIASEAVAHADGRWDPTSLTHYIQSYQKVTPLTLGELWALPGMLRLALIENLRRVSICVAEAQKERNLADMWVKRISDCAENKPADLIMVTAEMARSRPPLSSAFVAEMVRRLQDRGKMLSLPLTWVEQRLAEKGITTEQVIHRFNQQLASSHLSVSNSITGLRLLGETNWADFAEDMSIAEQTLRKDPSGIYPAMHFDTRDHYRHVIEMLARQSSYSEAGVALCILNMAQAPDLQEIQRHVGYYLIGDGRPQLEQHLVINTSRVVRLRHSFNQTPLLSWLGSLGLLTVAFTADVLFRTHEQGMTWPMIFLSLPLVVVLSQLAVNLLNEMTTRFRSPLPLPRMDFSGGIPAESATMVVIPCLLTSGESTDRLLNSLEVCHLGNNTANLYFALLTDFADSPEETAPGNDALMSRAEEQVQRLNQQYASASRPLFFLLHRSAKWNEQEKVWMGYERKRGKLSRLNSWLRGAAEPFYDVQHRAVVPPAGIKYIITLDSDTVLPRDTAHKLVATMAHPLNHPVYCPDRQRVVSGYGILQPGLAEEIPRHGQGRYAAMCSSVPGNDPYSMMSSDIYQDLFGEGSFVGKGIYEVDTFVRATRNTCPENLVLSHDLLEGCYARSGLLSEVLLYEQYPDNYLTDVARRTRWIRGDWQLLNWLRLNVRKADGTHDRNALSILSRWKLLDNLRRSLVAPSLLALVFCAILLVPNPLYWAGVLAAVLLLPTALGLAHNLISKPARRPFFQHLILVSSGGLKRLLRISLGFLTLPHEAGYSLHAIAVTLWRLGISHNNLSQWASFDQNTESAKRSPGRFYRAMWFNVAAGMALILLTYVFSSGLLLIALKIGVLWSLAPLLLSWMSREPARRIITFNAEHKRLLRQSSREIWAFFDTFVTDKENWLPPDNYQEIPRPVIAHRTSPTNIGLSLMATLTACDFGYIPQGNMLRRITLTLDTMDKMEHYRGHLYNWYDTRTLEPLTPRYISSVDSGNMAGHLLTLSAGLKALSDQPICNCTRLLSGLDDTLRILVKLWGQHAPTPLRLLHNHCRTAAALHPSLLLTELKLMRTQCHRLYALCSAEDSPVRRWLGHLHNQLVLICHEWTHFLSWLPATWDSDALPTLSWLAHAKHTDETMPPETAIRHARRRLKIIAGLELRLSEHARMDFVFLYNKSTHLLSVGYNCDSDKLDSSHYDLLPSEIRLTSFLAIATNQLPLKSWFALGRLFTTIDNETALMSWSGSMFEYLMPNLVMPTYPGSLLEEMSHSAVKRQIDWGKERGVPWGISESGYYSFDALQNYQYHAFGVPGLGLRRGLADDMVIAPYATMLALVVSPLEACENLQTLEMQGARGEYGFYEALDYTPSRLASGQTFALVRSWMAHHQGMAFQALSHVLLGSAMVDRFMTSPSFQSARLLLQERVPDAVELYSPRRHFEYNEGVLKPALYETREFNGVDSIIPEVQLLSNSSYHLMITQSGGGYSSWNDLALTRWRSDATCDSWGSFCYISDPCTGEVWSNTWQPKGGSVSHYSAVFNDAGAEFRLLAGTISVKTQIVVSPEDDIELRRVTLLHRGKQARTIELTTYAEVVLAPIESDLAHPAFSNLFIQTERVPEQHAILCHRRPRSPDERCPWMLHAVIIHGQTEAGTSFETDRAKFLGRGRTPSNAASAEQSGSLSNSDGSVLDPILAIRRTVILQPGMPVTVDIIYGVTESRQRSHALVEKYHDHPIADRVFELAWSHSQVVLRQINANQDDATLFNRLASAVLFPCPEMRAGPKILSKNRKGQSGLWGWSVSGDLPIVVLNVTRDESILLVTRVIQAHHYWRLKGLAVDLVILNDSSDGYQQALQNQIVELIMSSNEASQMDRHGGIFVRNGAHMLEEERILLLSVAQVMLDDRAGELEEQLNQRLKPTDPLGLPFIPGATVPVNQHTLWEPDTLNLLFFNGIGGFSEDGREYQILLNEKNKTPAPWSNVLANEGFGTVISEAGQAYTWYENAHEYRLTPWENDPVSDRSGEAYYVRDEESGAVWSPTTLPVSGSGHYLTRHGFGYSVFTHRETGIDTELTVLVAADAPVKIAILVLSNSSGRTRKLSVTGYVEWTLGESRSKSAMHVETCKSATGRGCGVLANNFYSSNGSERTAFFAVTGVHCSVTGDRREFLGRNGSQRSPAGLKMRTLSDNTGAGLDPCAAVQSATTLIDGDQRTFVFVLGIGQNPQDAESIINQYLSEDAARNEQAKVHDYWHRILDQTVIATPDPAVNLLSNGWLLYQTIACRLMARSGYYQSGGAFGFRDQLQDTLALSHAAPERLHAQILLCASRQFIEGDVQHWWHPPTGHGVRTRCSDDYLWLPLSMCHYVETTGDFSILEHRLPYLEGRILQPGEESVYEQPRISTHEDTLWQHGIKAIRHGLRFGQHGIPLMGAGDWNDGMNLVGLEGKGESVWLGFFLYEVLQKFAHLADQIHDNDAATLCRKEAAKLQVNIESSAWDGAWYRRGYFDSGEALGSQVAKECQIDAIVQSWAVLSGAGSAERCTQAMKMLDERLVDNEAGLIKLLAPPFDGNGPNPGYIQGYLPGVRENGGQYTHGAIWAVMAFARNGNVERAWQLWSLINPVNHGRTPEDMERYKVEPYVMTADIYSVDPHIGRGGWSWYTGSAGWAYRLVLETLLGVQRHGNGLTVRPLLPDAWLSVSLVYRHGESHYHINAARSDGEYEITLNGVLHAGNTIPLIDDGQRHAVEIGLGS
jgi:cellobiose phosphorylase